MTILGIETSCDETAAAVVDGDAKSLALRSNVVASSMDLHAKYGGVVPEIAARSHIEAIIPVIQQALDDAGCTWDDIDAIAVTHGAGLGGSLLVGVLTARTLAIAKNKPLYAINHVEAHLFVNFLTNTSLPNIQLLSEQPPFPLLGLIVSGGHTQLAYYRSFFDYDLLGQTLDDAIGEAFDKVGKLLGLPYPSGANVERIGHLGDPSAFKLPKAKVDTYDFSFSGLKTAVLRTCQQLAGHDHTLPSTEVHKLLSTKQKNDVAACFTQIACDIVAEKAVHAFREYSPKSLIVGGGVAANLVLRQKLASSLPIQVEYVDRQLCTDNGAMVATLGCIKSLRNQPQANPYSLDIAPNLTM